MTKRKLLTISVALGCSLLLLGACTSNTETEEESNGSEATENQVSENEQLTGSVIGDGSSTVAPIIEGIVEEYALEQPDVKVSVGVSGTGGGFEKFIAGETDFSNASRPIKDEEKMQLESVGIHYTEFKIANDGLTVVINPENDWATELTVEQLKQIWIEDGTTKKWSDIDSSWPNEEIVFYSPGTDSGTYDYFDEVILEGEDLVKAATLSEDDNVLVQGVEADKYAIGYFGYAYYLENKDKLTAVALDGVTPTNETIESGEYSPLSRPLFIYVKDGALKQNESFYNFMEYTLANAGEMAEAVGYVKLNDPQYAENLAKLESLK